MMWGENPYQPSLRLPTNLFLAGGVTMATLPFRWRPLNDFVHRIQIASEMGFNRRKLEDQRREAAEKEAANRRATDAQVLEDAERLITAWNERQAKRMPMLFSPTIGAANAAGYWFLWVRCPACRTINAIDLRADPDAVVPIMPAECTVCRTRSLHLEGSVLWHAGAVKRRLRDNPFLPSTHDRR
jgi:hypothetical protein